MNPGQIILLGFGAVVLVGGVMGGRAGSRVSFIAGSICGALLFGASLLAAVNLVAGLWLGIVVGLLLCVTSAMRLARTGKFIPSGLLLAVSVVATAALLYLALGAA